MPIIAAPGRADIDKATELQLHEHAVSHGHFQELRRRFAWFPTALTAVDYMYDVMLGQGRLERWQRELAFAAACDARGDDYLAAAARGELTRHRGVDDRIARAMIRGEEVPELGPVEAAIVAYARKAGTTPYKMVEGDVEALRAVGLGTEDVVEVLTVVCLSGYMSVLSQTAHLTASAEPAA